MAAGATGFDGWKCKKDEADDVAKRVEPLLARYFPQLDSLTTQWALAISSLAVFVGPRVFAWKQWQLDELEKAKQKQLPTGALKAQVIESEQKPAQA